MKSFGSEVEWVSDVRSHRDSVPFFHCSCFSLISRFKWFFSDLCHL